MDDTENEGGIASFTCQATGEPVPTISWYFNDVPVDVTNTVKYNVISTGSGQSSLRINNVQSSDVGTYTCNATNVVSSDTSSGVLTVCGEFYTTGLTDLIILSVFYAQYHQTLLDHWKDKSLLSLKEVMDQSYVQLQVILHQQLYGRTVMGVV